MPGFLFKPWKSSKNAKLSPDKKKITGLDLWNAWFFQETSSSQQSLEVFATKRKVKMPSRPWMGDRPPTPPPEPKQQKLVVVRGRVQTQASIESEDGKRDAEALVALSVSEKAVFIERTQTVRTNLNF